MDAFMDILLHRGFDDIRKWVDDFIIFLFGPTTPTSSSVIKPSSSSAFAIIDNSATDLGIPLHPLKRQPFGYVILYVGFLWNLEVRSVELPLKKREKYLAKVIDLMQDIAEAGSEKRQCALKPMLSVGGSLMHCTFVMKDARGFLVHIHKWLAKFPPDAPRFQQRTVSDEVWKELEWWRGALSAPKISRTLLTPALNDLYEFWVDASSGTGLGMVFRLRGLLHWDAWQWKENAMSGDRNIGWAEVVGLEFVTYAAAEFGLHDVLLRIRGDNQGAIAALNKRASRNIPSNESIIRITQNAAPLAITFSPIYVNTKINLADGPSRGMPDQTMPRHRLEFAVPDCLQTFLDHV